MPVVIYQSAIGLLGALIIFSSGFMQMIPKEQYHYKETASAMIFTLADSKTQVNKNDGKVKISFKNKRNDIEFDVEYSGEITPEDRTKINEIFSEIGQHVKRDKTIGERVKQRVKNKLRTIVDRI